MADHPTESDTPEELAQKQEELSAEAKALGEMLQRLAGNGGVCMVAPVTDFVSEACRLWRIAVRQGQELPRPEVTMAEVVAHIEHAREVAGVDHIGIGGDYDGTDAFPIGLEDVSCYPALFAALLDRGWSRDDCAKLAGENVLRALRDAEAVAARLQKEVPPSLATLESSATAG